MGKNHSQRMLIETVRSGGIETLTDDQAEHFVPMAYTFFEAAKRGEYERNLRILAEYIAGQLKQPTIDPGSVVRMTRRLEAITEVELQVLALTHHVMKDIIANLAGKKQGNRPFVNSEFLASHEANTAALSQWTIRVALAELATRGFLLADGAAGLDKAEEDFRATDALEEIMVTATAQASRTP